MLTYLSYNFVFKKCSKFGAYILSSLIQCTVPCITLFCSYSILISYVLSSSDLCTLYIIRDNLKIKKRQRHLQYVQMWKNNDILNLAIVHYKYFSFQLHNEFLLKIQFWHLYISKPVIQSLPFTLIIKFTWVKRQYNYEVDIHIMVPCVRKQ